MKTIIIAAITAIGLLTGTNTQAQNPMSIGIKAGASLSTSTVDDFNLTPGFMGGVVVDYELAQNMFIRSGIDFVMKGAKLDLFEGRDIGGTILSTEKYSKVHINYLQVPITIGYRTFIAPNVYGYLVGGIYGAYGIYASGRYTFNSNTPTAMTEQIKYEGFDELDLKQFDFGLLGSIGVEYGHYSVSIGYTYGFPNINRTSELSYPQNYTNGNSWHNMNASCVLGYRF